jgi:hypothetical protein
MSNTSAIEDEFKRILHKCVEKASEFLFQPINTSISSAVENSVNTVIKEQTVNSAIDENRGNSVGVLVTDGLVVEKYKVSINSDNELNLFPQLKFYPRSLHGDLTSEYLAPLGVFNEFDLYIEFTGGELQFSNVKAKFGPGEDQVLSCSLLELDLVSGHSALVEAFRRLVLLGVIEVSEF